MVELDQYKFTLNQYKEPMEELRLSLDLDKKEKTIQELEAEMEAGDFWSDPEKAQDIMKRVKGLKDTMASYTELTEAMEDISTMIEMGNEENDASLIPEIKEMLDAFEASFDKMKIIIFNNFIKENFDDKNNAIYHHTVDRGEVGSPNYLPYGKAPIRYEFISPTQKVYIVEHI